MPDEPATPVPDAPASPAPDVAPDPAPTEATRAPWWASRSLRGWVVAVVVALALSFALRTFCFESYFIPSGSMEPTLEIGDHVMVDKLSVDFGTINVGDIIVFKSPGAVATTCGDTVPDLVKRVVATPGDTIASVGNRIYVNHRLLHEAWSHNEPLGRAIPTTVVPAGDYYVLGDNHPDSCDSRYWGFVPRSAVIGKVFVRYWPLDRLGWF